MSSKYILFNHWMLFLCNLPFSISKYNNLSCCLAKNVLAAQNISRFCYIIFLQFVTGLCFTDRFVPFRAKQDGPNSGTTNREDKEIFEISAKGAIVFILVASVFLLLLFYFMSSWFVWLLIVLFCIGGIEVFSHTFVMCIVLFLIGTILTLLSLLFSLNVEVYLFFFFSFSFVERFSYETDYEFYRVCMFAWSHFSLGNK